MKLIAIAAIGRNGELGLKGDMPWKRSLKKDLAFFKKQTRNHAVLMGRKTFESIGKPLPDRTNIVISRTLKPASNLEVYPDLPAFLKAWSKKNESVYVIGGASLYEQLLDRCEQLVLSHVDQAFEADCYFPAFDPDQYKKTVIDETIDNGLKVKHVLYTDQRFLR